MSTEKRLGRGLASLLGEDTGGSQADSVPVIETTRGREIPVSSITANPMQPRRAFSERELSELADSVREMGILQPLVVRRVGESFELIAGERRLRAAQLAGLQTVPIVERETRDDDMLTLALVENLQRQDLNAIEKAKGFKALIDQFNLTQEAAAKRIGKDRSTIANFIRLLDLPESVQHVVSRGTISMGHARALLSLKQPSTQQAIALRIEEEGLSVREVERLVGQTVKDKPPRQPKQTATKSPYLRDIEDRARERLGSKVTIDAQHGRGKLVIHFYSDDDLERVLDVLGISYH